MFCWVCFLATSTSCLMFSEFPGSETCCLTLIWGNSQSVRTHVYIYYLVTTVLGLSCDMQDLCHVGSFVKLQSTRFSCLLVGGIKPSNLQPFVLQGRFLTTGPPGKSEFLIIIASNIVSFFLLVLSLCVYCTFCS